VSRTGSQWELSAVIAVKPTHGNVLVRSARGQECPRYSRKPRWHGVALKGIQIGSRGILNERYCLIASAMPDDREFAWKIRVNPTLQVSRIAKQKKGRFGPFMHCLPSARCKVLSTVRSAFAFVRGIIKRGSVSAV